MEGKLIPTGEQPEVKIECELDGLPIELADEFSEIPKEIRDRILGKDRISAVKRVTEKDQKVSKKGVFGGMAEGTIDDFVTLTPRDIFSTLEGEEKEFYIGACLREMFDICEFNDDFKSLETDEIGPEIDKFMEYVWGLRGLDEDEIEAYNNERYERQLAKHQELVGEIGDVRKKIEEQRVNIEKTRKQKRLTEVKKGELNNLILELQDAEEKLDKWNFDNNNLLVHRGRKGNIRSRQEREEEWLGAISMGAEYLEPDEFATVVYEHFINQTFHAADRAVNYPGRRDTVEDMERGKEILDIISDTIEEWNIKHGDEKAMKVNSETTERRINKLVEYSISLYKSYIIKKKEGYTEDELIATIRQMEITFKTLAKIG